MISQEPVEHSILLMGETHQTPNHDRIPDFWHHTSYYLTLTITQFIAVYVYKPEHSFQSGI